MNSGYITEALVARLRDPASEAVAPNRGPRLLRDMEAGLHAKSQPVADFAEVFRRMAGHEPGTHGLLFILARPDVSAHAVIITNHQGVPTIVEGQCWGPAYPQTTYTSPAEAEARYGTAVDLRLGIVPDLP
ncbi:MAG: hypothetical protein EOO56_13880 [Hymenobacter sp.]|nr:MAG: hypothetical protein EOO56_13880 [Hymenobacter sp.]